MYVYIYIYVYFLGDRGGGSSRAVRPLNSIAVNIRSMPGGDSQQVCGRQRNKLCSILLLSMHMHHTTVEYARRWQSERACALAHRAWMRPAGRFQQPTCAGSAGLEVGGCRPSAHLQGQRRSRTKVAA